jgi:hypothetical protein
LAPFTGQVGVKYWHGTTRVSLPDALESGLKESADPTIHEFTTRVYVADHRDCSLYYHATAVKMTADAAHWDAWGVRRRTS